jgi:hypothetical protein
VIATALPRSTLAGKLRGAERDRLRLKPTTDGSGRRRGDPPPCTLRAHNPLAIEAQTSSEGVRRNGPPVSTCSAGKPVQRRPPPPKQHRSCEGGAWRSA